MDHNPAAIPRHLLRDLYIVLVAKKALVRRLCPGYRWPLEVIDTWERAYPNPSCDYTFNWYHLAARHGAVHPEPGVEPEPADNADIRRHIQEAITATLHEHFDLSCGPTPTTESFHAGNAVGTTRRLAQRALTDAERQQAWGVL